MVLRDDEVPALFTNKSPHQLGLADVLSASATGEFPEETDRGRRYSTVALEPHIGLTPAVEAMIEPARAGSCYAA
ncbi:hypothetical protein KCP77_05795 [Salmonella enterica subsp. enterica]|nr:hypothetical protein KCP77_05795 [Salmonella enterica subsp. enterica]